MILKDSKNLGRWQELKVGELKVGGTDLLNCGMSVVTIGSWVEMHFHFAPSFLDHLDYPRGSRFSRMTWLDLSIANLNDFYSE